MPDKAQYLKMQTQKIIQKFTKLYLLFYFSLGCFETFAYERGDRPRF